MNALEERNYVLSLPSCSVRSKYLSNIKASRGLGDYVDYCSACAFRYGFHPEFVENLQKKGKTTCELCEAKEK